MISSSWSFILYMIQLDLTQKIKREQNMLLCAPILSNNLFYFVLFLFLASSYIIWSISRHAWIQFSWWPRIEIIRSCVFNDSIFIHINSKKTRWHTSYTRVRNAMRSNSLKSSIRKSLTNNFFNQSSTLEDSIFFI